MIRSVAAERDRQEITLSVPFSRRDPYRQYKNFSPDYTDSVFKTR